MITTIDNNQRKFLVMSQGFGNTKDIFCNLIDIPKVITEFLAPNEEFLIFEFWNRKLKKCSQKHINSMFLANQIMFRINGTRIEKCVLKDTRPKALKELKRIKTFGY